jgi:hypothetical protein
MYYPIISQAMCFACCLLDAGFCLGLFFSPEDRSDMFLWNVEWLSTGYTVLYLR